MDWKICSRRHTNDLVTEEILASRNAAWDLEGYLALVGDEGIDGPRLGRGGQSGLVDLEPLEACHRGLRRTWNLRAVYKI